MLFVICLGGGEYNYKGIKRNKRKGEDGLGTIKKKDEIKSDTQTKEDHED